MFQAWGNVTEPQQLDRRLLPLGSYRRGWRLRPRLIDSAARPRNSGCHQRIATTRGQLIGLPITQPYMEEFTPQVELKWFDNRPTLQAAQRRVESTLLGNALPLSFNADALFGGVLACRYCTCRDQRLACFKAELALLLLGKSETKQLEPCIDRRKLISRSIERQRWGCSDSRGPKTLSAVRGHVGVEACTHRVCPIHAWGNAAETQRLDRGLLRPGLRLGCYTNGS
eukprot:scaffold10284_cov118-Isochrysis_galbana.AAC.12